MQFCTQFLLAGFDCAAAMSTSPLPPPLVGAHGRQWRGGVAREA